MNCIVRHHKLKFQRAFVIQRELINGYIRNLQAVYKGAVFIDDQSLQKPVLVPGRKPPAGGKKSVNISEISGTGPGAYWNFIEGKSNV